MLKAFRNIFFNWEKQKKNNKIRLLTQTQYKEKKKLKKTEIYDLCDFDIMNPVNV